MMLKLKLWYFGHLMRRGDSFDKTLMLGKVEGRRRRGQQRMRWLHGITDSTDMSLSEFQTGSPGVLRFMGSQRVAYDWATELNWISSSRTLRVQSLHEYVWLEVEITSSFEFPTRRSKITQENNRCTFLVSENFCGSQTWQLRMFGVLRNRQHVCQWQEGKGTKNTRPTYLLVTSGFFGHSVNWLKPDLLTVIYLCR